MDTVSVTGVKIVAAAAAAAFAEVVVVFALLFLFAGSGGLPDCEVARSKAFRLRVVGAVVARYARLSRR
jgi:hypothetical protein